MTPQEGFRMKQSGSRRMRKGHLREGERGWSVGQDGRTFQDETYTSGRCEQEAKGKGMTGHQEKLSRMSREHVL